MASSEHRIKYKENLYKSLFISILLQMSIINILKCEYSVLRRNGIYLNNTTKIEEKKIVAFSLQHCQEQWGFQKQQQKLEISFPVRNVDASGYENLTTS